MTRHRFTPASGIALALGAFMTMLAAAATTSGQVSQKLTLALPKLEVKQFSGDFTQWGLTGSIEKTGAQKKEFRWRINRTGVARARYEVSTSPFPASPIYVNSFTLASKMVSPQSLSPTAENYFTIDFKPLVQYIFGQNQSSQITFHVRLVLLNAQNQPLSPVSQTVKVDYTLPAGGTKLEQSMMLRLQTIRCIRRTSGGLDDIAIIIDGASSTLANYGKWAKVVFQHSQEEIDAGWEIKPSVLLWEYRGLGFSQKAYILVAVAESDAFEGSEDYVHGLIKNRGHNTARLLADLNESWCVVRDYHACLGPPKIVPVTLADWHKVALGGQTVTKLLRFAGDGGLYEVTFELSPK